MVVAVADERNRRASDVAATLVEGLHIRQQLARVEAARHAVHHRYRRGGGKTLDLGMLQRADHHGVHHFRQHPGGVFYLLAATKLRARRADM